MNQSQYRPLNGAETRLALRDLGHPISASDERGEAVNGLLVELARRICELEKLNEQKKLPA